jgi:UDP-GlcNAc:undecaprenyl-phosphate GlcNAc-1-phosphate transferase
MNNLLALVAAMVISMVLIPIMVRFAPRLGLIDRPNARKVHAVPIPRVGGIGIVLGGLTVIMFLLPPDKLTYAYLLGAFVLFVFGVWDDIFEIGHYTKFVGQLIAALILVLYGDLYVVTFPFVPGGEIPATIGVPFTLFALLGMINAINHSDGLDGLAGGESLFSLGAIAFLAILAEEAGADGVVVFTIAVAVIGGLLGFLRYNTHPARVFMGDSGSQFLGYTLGCLAILLTQKVDPKLSPAVVLLLLGLPIIDILMVLVKRARAKANLFKATRNHIHHRLLDLGFVHQESVVIIYSLQMVFVTSGILLRYESNFLIIAVYILLCTAVFGALVLAERSGWRVGGGNRQARQTNALNTHFLRNALVVVPRRFLQFGIPAYMIATSLFVKRVPRDFAEMSLLVLGILVIEMFIGDTPRSLRHRALIYITVAFVGFLGINYSPQGLEWLEPVKVSFFLLVALAFATAVKYSPRRRKLEFETTATDYLVVFSMLAILIASKGDLWGSDGIAFVVQMVVLFYGCELLITEKRGGRWSILSTATAITAAILAYRGLLSTLW